MFRWCSTLSLLAAVLVLPMAAHSDDNSNTLSQLRADLSQGQLDVLLQRQDIVPLPASTIKPWVQAQPIDRFAITGFNESGQTLQGFIRVIFWNNPLNHTSSEKFVTKS